MASAKPEQPRKVESAPLRDPGVSYGRFRPLSRTDGLAIVYDPELPIAKRSVGGRTWPTFREAEDYARALAMAEPRGQE